MLTAAGNPKCRPAGTSAQDADPSTTTPHWQSQDGVISITRATAVG